MLMKIILFFSFFSLFHQAIALENGDNAPNFIAGELFTNEQISLEKFRGKIVYLDFWASWCPPCLVSLPAMNKLQDMLQRENINFEILAVSVDKDIEDAQYFIEDHPVDFILLSDTIGTVPALFNLKAMPTSFILDKNGTVIYKHEGFKVSDINIIAEKIRALSND